MSAKIEVKNISKVFGPRPESVIPMIQRGKSKKEVLEETNHNVGVNDASFQVEEGEIFVIMGLSGSGKSTLIRCLNLLNQPTTGSIMINGEDIVAYDKRKLKEFRQNTISMVFQHFGLLSHQTVAANIGYGLEVKGVSKEERMPIIERTLNAVGLKGWGEKYPSELSGGMQQRVGLARAIADDPEILLMDEPFSALDPLIRRDMQKELLDIQSKINMTIVFITHDVNEAFKLGDRVAVIRDGKIEQIGTPVDILNHPNNDYIEDFVQDIDRSKVLKAKHIVNKAPVIQINDSIKTAVNTMEKEDVSYIFVVNSTNEIQGLVIYDDAIKMHGENKLVKEILVKEYFTAHLEMYIQDLIDLSIDSQYPIAVVDSQNKLKGMVDRLAILSALTAKEY